MMEDAINKEFEEWQKVLEIEGKRLKGIAKFETDEDTMRMIDELKGKEIVL